MNLEFKIKNYFILLPALYLVLCVPVSFAQDIHKTRSSAVIGGVKYYLHTVEKGQTLFAIAKFYNRDVNDIVIENPEAIDGIKPGQILRIPVEKKKPVVSTVSDTSNYKLHKVEKGQTLYSISKQYGVSVDKIKFLNPELKEGLKEGQIIKISSLLVSSDKKGNVKSSEIKQEKIIPKENANQKIIPEKSSHSIYEGELKEEYNIAFFLPFHSEEANAMDMENLTKGLEQFPNKTRIALQYYEGALIALDSLKKQKLKIRLFVYDVDDIDSLYMVKLLKKPELAEMDLIIGPLYGSSFLPVSKFAKEKNIPIVSPFTQANKILFNNEYVCKVAPSTILQVEQMARFVADTFSTQNIILVNNNSDKEASFYSTFKTNANQLLLERKKDTIKEARGYGGVQSFLNKSKVNVIVLPSNNQSYVSDFLSNLNILSDKYQIVLFGMQNWLNFDNLDFEYLTNLSVHIPDNNFVEYDSLTTKKFIKAFREKYNTDPDPYAFQGFDVTYYFVTALQKYGTGFLEKLDDYKLDGVGNGFDFYQYPANSGFENKFVFILQYKDHKLVKAN